MAAEAKRIQSAIPEQSVRIALDEHGKDLSTEKFSQVVQTWQNNSQPLALLIGGPDGLDPELKTTCSGLIRLSSMTMPHPLVRVVLIENLRRLPQDYPNLRVVPLEQNYRSTGHILRAANAVIARNPKLFEKKLWSELGDGEPVRVVEADFLSTTLAPVDVVCMNPPYEGGLDGAFLERAMELAPRVVALLRLNALVGQERHERVWSRIGRGWHLDVVAYLARRPVFLAAGAATDGAKSDFVAVRLTRGTRARKTRTEWWT